MSKLVKFNEMLSSKEELDLMDEIKSRLVFLMDDGLKIDSEKSKYHDTIFTIHTGKQKLWIDLKDYIIPLFISLDKDYNCYPPFPSTSSDNNLTKDKFIRVQFKGLGNKYFSIDEIEDMKNYKEKIFSIGTLVSRKNKKES